MKKSSFIEGAIIASVAIIITKIIGILYVIPFYSIIGTQGGALYGYAYNIYNVFLILSTAGVPLAVSKLTSEYNALKMEKQKIYLFQIARKFIMIFSIVAFLVCFLGAYPLAHLILGNVVGSVRIAEVALVIRWVSFALLVVPSLSVMRGYLQGHNYIAVSSFSQVVEQVVRVVIILAGSLLALKIFHLTIAQAVGIAVFASCVGALAGYFFLRFKVHKLTKFDCHQILNKTERKAVSAKLITYILPFVLVSICGHLYNSTDMILLIQGLHRVGFGEGDIENISSIFTTWGNKMVSIVTSIGSGIIVSLIPSLVKAYVKKNKFEVNKQFNKALQILFYVILPLALFMSVFAREMWFIFYGVNYYGPIIMRYLFIIAFFSASFTMTCAALQGLNKRKEIYISILLGLGLNAGLDLPLIFLFAKLGIYPFYGAITATLIGYMSSLIFVLISLHKTDGLDYKPTFKQLPLLLVKIAFLVGGCFLVQISFKNIQNRFLLLGLMIGTGFIYGGIYYLGNRKIIKSMLEPDFFKKLIRKSN